MPTKTTNNGFFKGKVTSELQHFKSDIDEIKGDLKEIKHSVEGLKYFKAKVYGAATAISTAISGAFYFLKHK